MSTPSPIRRSRPERDGVPGGDHRRTAAARTGGWADGAPARLRRARIDLNLRHRRLILAAGRAAARSHAEVSFSAVHVRYLLGELEVRGDLPLLTTALLAPLEVPVLEQEVEIEKMHVHRVIVGWDDLVRRVVA